MLIYLLILTLQFHTFDKPMTIQPHPSCENVPNVQYDLSEDRVCLPPDLIFKDGFN